MNTIVPMIHTHNLSATRDLNPFGIDRIMKDGASKPLRRLL